MHVAEFSLSPRWDGNYLLCRARFRPTNTSISIRSASRCLWRGILSKQSRYRVINFIDSISEKEEGWRKLEEICSELQPLTRLRHTSLHQTYAVKLEKRGVGLSPCLYILREEEPNFTLNDMLKGCDTLPLRSAMVAANAWYCMIVSDAFAAYYPAKLGGFGEHAWNQSTPST